jgi:hypothetical protein
MSPTPLTASEIEHIADIIAQQFPTCADQLREHAETMRGNHSLDAGASAPETLCVVCQAELPPLNQWSMPACPSCTEKAERASGETGAHHPDCHALRLPAGECNCNQRAAEKTTAARKQCECEECRGIRERKAEETTADVRALFNKGLGVLKDNRFSFSFETAEEAERAFHYIADLGTLETGSAGDVKAGQP